VTATDSFDRETRILLLHDIHLSVRPWDGNPVSASSGSP